MASPFSLRRSRSGEALVRFKRALDRNPAGLLRQIGMILLEDSQRAFDEQRFGDKAWPERYPRQKPPRVNVAGIVADFAAGRKTPPKRRFQPRPAGLDTGMLRRSLQSASKAIRPQAWSVFVGTTVPYAGKFHAGGKSRQTVTSTVKKLLAAFLRKKKNRIYGQRLGFLFRRSALETKSPARPIVGVTARAEKRINLLIREWFEGGGAQGAAV